MFRKRKKGKTICTGKITSLMIVPHNSNKIKTLRVSNLHLKLITFIALLIVMSAALVGYLTIILHENDQLKNQQYILSSFFEEQQRAVQDNISEIAEIKDLDIITREKLEEFSLQVQDLTSNYIDKEVKSLTVSRSSVSGVATSFVGKIAELKALLNFLEDTDKKGDELFSALAEKQEELRYYLEHLPTYWPTKGIIESGFGNRFHPVYKKFMDHTGADIGGKKGNPIYAAASGKVVFAAKNGGYGYCVDIDHGNGIITRYAHCMKILVKKGQSVKVGEKIALVGDTGVSTGPHLHFEIRIKDTPIDPTLFIGTEP
jgi:murein DD-endopeptidase MepM/ murein hydrolase activator NlpD